MLISIYINLIKQTIPSIFQDVLNQVLNKQFISDGNHGNKGTNVHFESNTEWALPDVDYTPYTNILSAVWPTLRHKSYTWGVIQATVNNVDRFYKSFTDIIITDPCSHPDVITCGHTGNYDILIQI